MKEQQSGLVKHGSYASHFPPLTQQQLNAAARRQADSEADPSYEGLFAGVHPEHRPSLSGPLPSLSAGNSARTRASFPVEAAGEYELEEDESYYTTRLPTSARHYQQGNRRYHVGYVNIPPRTSRQAQLGPPRQRYRDEEATLVPPATRSRRRMHPLVYVGVGMLAMVAFFLMLSSAATWVEQKRDDLTYGRPRTFQLDAVVGHNDSPERLSHFLALNLNRHVEVIEIPGGDSTRERVYLITILFGDGEDLTPVTLSFRDVNGDGKPDMLVHIENQTVVEINDNGQFRPAKPGEVKGLLSQRKRGKSHDQAA